MNASKNLSKLALVALMALGAAAQESAASAVEFRSGGVTAEEFQQLQRDARNYSMQLVLAAKGSGAYLADVDVIVKSLSTGDVVLEHRTEGPLLLASLPPGAYEITARFDDVRPGAASTLKRVVRIPSKGMAKSILYFETGDEVGAESPPEFRIR